MTMPRTLRRKTPNVVPATTPPVRRSRAGWPCLAAALVTAALLWQCFFPADFGWQAWFALVPWLMLVRADLPSRRRYLYAWLAGFAMYVPALSWMRTGFSEMVVFWLLLALYCSSYFPAALWLLRRLDRRTRLPLTVTVPLVWTALEFARGRLMGGFAWYFLGHTQHAFLPVIQVADVAGVAAVTFVVAAVNGLLAEAAGHFTAVRNWFQLPVPIRRPGLRLQVLAVALVLCGTLGYGSWQLAQGGGEPGPRVALLQPSIPQTDRNAASLTEAGDPLAQRNINEQMSELTRKAVGGPDLPDLVVWPETTFIWEQKAVAAGSPDSPELAEWRKDIAERESFVRQIATFSGTNVLLGLNVRGYAADGTRSRYNSAMLVTPAGQMVSRYDKMHLVPFGEYIPLKGMFPAIERLSPYGSSDYTITPGETQSRLPLRVGGRTFQFGVLICYEDADAPLARRLVADAPADFIVNISNDGWFMGTAEHAAHLAVSRFRAVECRRSLVRAVNGGISAVIDGSGRVVAQPADTWAKSHSVTRVVTAAVPLDTRPSFYARFGDWLPWTCCGLLLVGCCLRSGAPTP